MKRIFSITLAASMLLGVASCGGNDNSSSSGGNQDAGATPEAQAAAAPQPGKPAADRKPLYTGEYNRDNTFTVISKRDLVLTVYAPVNGDTVPIVDFPVCLSRVKGQKQGKGDMKTPECDPSNPFKIIQMQDASDWKHDFGDGRGEILSYGHWFLRLETPGHSGIGIHGSTNNESSVPGRDSEGCIRMRDNDIITFKENYARVGMPVIIKHEEQGLLPFEVAK